MIALSYDDWKSTDAADREDDRTEVCDRCGVAARPDQGSAIILPGSSDEGWFCYPCCDEVSECDVCNRRQSQCVCPDVAAFEYEPDLDWDDYAAEEE